MAVALTPFRGFCGFLPHPTLLLLLTTVPEMRSLIGTDALQALAQASEPALPFPNPDAEDYHSTVQELEKLAKKASSSERNDSFETTDKEKEALKRVFEILMNSSEEQYTAALRALITRYGSDDPACESEFEKTLIPLVKELNGQFPDDIGVLCCFVLNVVEMEKGAAMFLKADEPHAYISGGESLVLVCQSFSKRVTDIIECMATSGMSNGLVCVSIVADSSTDNVVRAGLTPKLRDVPTLVSMLTYTSAPAHAQLLQPTEFAPKTQLYDPPIDEFSVLQVKLVGADSTETHRPIEGPSLCVVTEGSGKIAAKGGKNALEVKRGMVVFIAAETEVEMTGGKEGLELYRAYVEA